MAKKIIRKKAADVIKLQVDVFKVSYMLMPNIPPTVTTFEFCSQVDCSPAGRANAQGRPSHITQLNVYVRVHSVSVRTEKLVPVRETERKIERETVREMIENLLPW